MVALWNLLTILSCDLARILQLSSNKSAIHEIASTMSFLSDTNLVLRLTSIAAWNRVDLRVKEESQLQGWHKAIVLARDALGRLSLLGTNTTGTNSENPGSLRRAIDRKVHVLFSETLVVYQY
jgi:hypothetical protein